MSTPETRYRTYTRQGVNVLVMDSTPLPEEQTRWALAYGLQNVNLARANLVNLTVNLRLAPWKQRINGKPHTLVGLYQQMQPENAVLARVVLSAGIAPERFKAGPYWYGLSHSLRLLDRFGLPRTDDTLAQIKLHSPLEMLIFVLAHEARHLWQKRISARSWSRGEYDADLAGLRALMRYRRDFAGEPGVGPVYEERTTQPQPAHFVKKAG